MVEDTPDDIIHDIFASQVWKATRSAGRSSARASSSPASIAMPSPGYFGEEYVPSKVIIAVAGNVTHDQAVDLFGAGFNGFQRTPVERTHTTPGLTARP